MSEPARAESGGTPECPPALGRYEAAREHVADLVADRDEVVAELGGVAARSLGGPADPAAGVRRFRHEYAAPLVAQAGAIHEEIAAAMTAGNEDAAAAGMPRLGFADD